jgi:hypothetical protein
MTTSEQNKVKPLTLNPVKLRYSGWRDIGEIFLGISYATEEGENT